MSAVDVGPVTAGLRSHAISDSWFRDDDRNWRYGYGRGTDGAVAATEAFAAFAAREADDPNLMLMGVYDDVKPVGYVALEYLGPSTRTVRASPFFSDDRIEVVHVALERIMEHTFKSFGKKIHRIKADLLRSNPLLEAFRMAGFKQEGIRRSAHWIGINSFDLAPMRILRPDWVKLQQEN